MSVYYCIAANHPVFHSCIYAFKKIFKKVEEYPNYRKRTSIFLNTTHIELFHLRFEKNDVYLTYSPILQPQLFVEVLKGTPMIFLVEYYRKNFFKDILFSFVFSLVKNYPLIAMTKRTYVFFRSRGFDIFFIPPTEKKRKTRPVKEREHILFIGRMFKNKNPFLFIELAKKFPNEIFVMIGKGPLEQKVAHSVKSIPNIKYIPHVRSRKLLFERYISRAKLLVHPASKDPIGHVIIESLSVGTPVLASCNTGASDFLPRRWRIDSLELDAWKKKMKIILENLPNEIKTAKEVFDKQHLCIWDRYLKEIAVKLKNKIKNKWPWVLEE